MKPLFVIACLCLGAAVAQAQDDRPPRCDERVDGAALCMAQRVCTCKYATGSAFDFHAKGWHWDCDMGLTCNMPPTNQLPQGFTYSPQYNGSSPSPTNPSNPPNPSYPPGPTYPTNPPYPGGNPLLDPNAPPLTRPSVPRMQVIPPATSHF